MADEIMPTKEEFERFEKVRESGVCNMYSSDVQIYASLSRDTHRAIIRYYDILKEKYGKKES
jgi:hypothetical protein